MILTSRAGILKYSNFFLTNLTFPILSNAFKYQHILVEKKINLEHCIMNLSHSSEPNSDIFLFQELQAY